MGARVAGVVVRCFVKDTARTLKILTIIITVMAWLSNVTSNLTTSEISCHVSE
jgi:hypothetical protein